VRFRGWSNLTSYRGLRRRLVLACFFINIFILRPPRRTLPFFSPFPLPSLPLLALSFPSYPLFSLLSLISSTLYITAFLPPSPPFPPSNSYFCFFPPLPESFPLRLLPPSHSSSLQFGLPVEILPPFHLSLYLLPNSISPPLSNLAGEATRDRSGGPPVPRAQVGSGSTPPRLPSSLGTHDGRSGRAAPRCETPRCATIVRTHGSKRGRGARRRGAGRVGGLRGLPLGSSRSLNKQGPPQASAAQPSQSLLVRRWGSILWLEAAI